MDSWFKLTNIKLHFTKDKESLLLLEHYIRGGISSVMGDHYIESDENTKLLYIDANNLYGWARSQYLFYMFTSKNYFFQKSMNYNK